MDKNNNSDFGNDLVTLVDEDGVEVTFEHIDTYEMNGITYMAFLPENADDLDSYDITILKVEYDETTGDEFLVSLEDDEEEQELFDIFSDRLEDSFTSSEDVE